jgi:hypothetical protein
VNVNDVDIPPPGVGVSTETLAWPADARSVAGIWPVSVLPAKYVVGTEAPFHSICEAAMNCVPVTVNVNAGPPAFALDGEIDVKDGTGFGGMLTVKVREAEAPPPGAGFCTVTFAVPAALRSAAGTSAVNDVLETKVVDSAESFQWITEDARKPVPDAVTVSAELPALVEAGVIAESVGEGFCVCIGWPPPPPQPIAIKNMRDTNRKPFRQSFQFTKSPKCPQGIIAE